jgi:hypothetical protein
VTAPTPAKLPHGLTAHHTDIGAEYAEGDTTLTFACSFWNGCQNLNLYDYFSALDIADYLSRQGYAGCQMLGGQLAAAVQNGRVKRGLTNTNSQFNTTNAITTGASGNQYTPNGYTVLNPSSIVAFENRAILTHEAMHMSQYDHQQGTFPTRGYTTLWQAEAEAYGMETSCQ